MLLLSLACADTDSIGTTGLDSGGPDETDVTVVDDYLPADVCPVYVATSGSPDGAGTESDPLASVDDAVTRVHPECAEVQVASGTYAERVDLGTRDVVLTGDDATLAPPAGAGLVIAGAQTSATVIEGFTITGGTGEPGAGTYDSTETVGGGVYVYRASPTLRALTLVGNAADRGGGLMLYESYGRVEDCVFDQNRSTTDEAYGGGAVHIYQSAPEIVGSTFRDNQHPQDGGAGGAILMRRSDATIQDCAFVDNLAEATGGAIRSADGQPTIVQNRFSGNDPDAITVSYADGGLVANNTVLTSAHHGLRVHCPSSACEDGGPTTAFHNNLVQDSVYFGATFLGSHQVTWSHNLFWDSGSGTYDGFDTDEDVEADPLLTDWTPADDSPAIDAGIDVGLPFEGDAPDIGAVEVR